MKNLLNCHSIGLHSFPVSLVNGLYKRIFYADIHHNMWKPFEVAVHPHHVDIKIVVLEGELFNPLYKVDENGELLTTYQWNSHILNGNGGFEKIGQERLTMISSKKHKAGDEVIMKACELHTVYVERGKKCIWLIEESIPSCEYFPVNYSPHDLTKWTPQGLYIEVDDTVKQHYIGKYLQQVN